MAPPSNNQHYSDAATATSSHGRAIPAHADRLNVRSRTRDGHTGTDRLGAIKRILRMWYL